MKELLIPFTNWRVHVLAVLGMVAAVLILSEESEDASMLSFLVSKAIGFGIAYIIHRLGKYWDSKGKINELMALADEED